MEASLARIHGGVCCRPKWTVSCRLLLSPAAGFVFYGRRRTSPVLFSVSMSLEGSRIEASHSEIKITTTYTTAALNQHVEDTDQSNKPDLDDEKKSDVDAALQMAGLEQKKAAKIHDFCFGIPFGGIVFSGGLVSFLFARNSSSLNGVLCGAALLLLSISSLKVWKQGKSSFPFILGQAALAGTLLWKHLQIYYSTKKLFPTGLFAILSAAMLSFFTYVMASGGNPPKKLKSTASPSY